MSSNEDNCSSKSGATSTNSHPCYYQGFVQRGVGETEETATEIIQISLMITLIFALIIIAAVFAVKFLIVSTLLSRLPLVTTDRPRAADLLFSGSMAGTFSFLVPSASRGSSPTGVCDVCLLESILGSKGESPLRPRLIYMRANL
jgi:hypothetical protein